MNLQGVLIAHLLKKWQFVIEAYELKAYGLMAFSVIAPILWNDLPIDIRSIDNVYKFNKF